MNSVKTLFIAFLLFVAAGISSNLLAQQKTLHVKVVSNGKSADSVFTVTYSADSKNKGKHEVVSVINNELVENSVNPGDSVIEIEVESSDENDQANNGRTKIMMFRHSRGSEDEEDIDESNGTFPVIFSTSSCTCKEKCCNNDSCMKKEMKRKIYVHMNSNGPAGGKRHNMKYVVRRNGGEEEDVEKQMEMIPLTASKDTTITHISPQGDTIKIHRKVLEDGGVEQEVTVNKHSKDSSGGQFFTYNASSGKNRMMIRKMRAGNDEDENFEYMMPPRPPSHSGVEEMNLDYPDMPTGIDENADFGKIKVTPLEGKNIVRISLDLSGKETTVIKINDEKGRAVFEEKVKDLTGKYVRDIDMSGNARGKYSLGIDRGKSSITKQFSY
jgi:hypothetical protein